MPLGITNTGCGTGCYAQSGFLQTNWEDINFITYTNFNSAYFSAQQINKRYSYEGNTYINLQYIYYTCMQPGHKTSIYIYFTLGFSSANNFPDHYLEFGFYDLTLSNSFSTYSIGSIIPCQLSSNFLSISNRNTPQCRIGYFDTGNNLIKVRI
jgi:hypothetical protein